MQNKPEDFVTYNPAETSPMAYHAVVLSSVAPRPIAFVSTVDEEGRVNLSPFSYFNVFGVNPVTLVFSPANRVRDNTTKHTLENVKKVKECVVSIVTYDMVEQTSLASCEYPEGVNEFIKAGFTEQASSIVKPPRVLESPVSFECKVLDIYDMGNKPGAGNLVICEVLLTHVHSSVITEGKVDTTKMNLVGRMGADYYVKAAGDALFKVPKPNTSLGIGIDALPEIVKHNELLTGNELGRLGNLTAMPDAQLIASKKQELSDYDTKSVIVKAKELLQDGSTEEALLVLMSLV